MKFSKHYRIWRKTWAVKRAVRNVFQGRSTIARCGKIKPVYFFGKYKVLSFKIGALYLIETLKRMGVNAASGQNIRAESIHDSILVFVKENIPKNLAALKANGNKIIIDMHDNFILPDGALNPDFIGRDIADYLIFPNQALLNAFLSLKPTTSKCVVLYGYADPQITAFFQANGYQKFNELKCCFFGYPWNLDLQMLNVLHGPSEVGVIPLTQDNFEKVLPKLKSCNMHIDYFRPNEVDYLYKPLMKILIAAECRSNIIIKKTPRILELLPEDYPFLVEGNNVESVMRKAHTLFNTPMWEKSLETMDRIRETYTFRSHMNKFVTLLESLSFEKNPGTVTPLEDGAKIVKLQNKEEA